MILGDYGADVIKVEKPGSSSSVVSSMRNLLVLSGQGDDTRTWGPPYVEDQSAYFLSINRNKRSIAIDMSREQGQTIIREVRAHHEHAKFTVIVFWDSSLSKVMFLLRTTCLVN